MNSTNPIRHNPHRPPRGQRHQIRQLRSPLRRRRQGSHHRRSRKVKDSRHDPHGVDPRIRGLQQPHAVRAARVSGCGRERLL